jgi:hypothetical protein
MTEIPDTPDELFAQWRFEDNFRGIAIELITAGAHLGSLALARNIIAAQIVNGNRTLRYEELTKLIDAVKLEIRAEAEKGINNARGHGAE